MLQTARRSFAGFGTPKETPLFPGVKRLTELVVTSGSGCNVFTDRGKRYLDFTAGIGVLSTGHCHPTVVDAVREQAGKITHAQQSIMYNDTTLLLADRLLSVAPPGLDSIFFANSGGEAIESALRLARQATGKDTVISFLGGYHGRTSGCLAVTSSSSSFRGCRSGPLPNGTAWAQYPYEHAGVSCEQSLASLDLLLTQQATQSEVAAVLIEPILGEGGYIVPPKGFMCKLKSWCEEKDILLIADEVQCGAGRTGKMWAVDHDDVHPDILVSAKGIASGYPLSAVISKSEFSAKQSLNSMGGTYGGNPVTCAAAIATLDVIEEENLLHNAKVRGEQLVNGLKQYPAEIVGEVRGRGLMVGFEFSDQVPKGTAAAISKACFDRGLLLLPTGHRETLRFVPSLIVSKEEVEEALDIFGESMTLLETKCDANVMGM